MAPRGRPVTAHLCPPRPGFADFVATVPMCAQEPQDGRCLSGRAGRGLMRGCARPRRGGGTLAAGTGGSAARRVSSPIPNGSWRHPIPAPDFGWRLVRCPSPVQVGLSRSVRSANGKNRC